MVLGTKTNFFLGKTKKNHLFGVWPHSFPKDVFCWFFWFCLGKSWFFLPKTIFFLSRTIFFPRENQKKNIFLEFGRIVSKDGFFGFP